MYSSPLLFTPMSLAFEMTLDNVTSGVIKNIYNDLLKFFKHHKDDSYLLGNKIWDDDFTNRIAIELW